MTLQSPYGPSPLLLTLNPWQIIVYLRKVLKEMRYLTISRKRCYQSLVRAGDGKELPDKSCSSGLEMQTQ